MLASCKNSNLKAKNSLKERYTFLTRTAKVYPFLFKYLKESELFVVKYKEVIIKYKKNYFNIPIYNGKKNTITDKVLQNYIKKDAIIIDELFISVNKNKVKEAIIDCIDFYSKNIFKNLKRKKHSLIAAEGPGLFIWYDFKYKGIDCHIVILTNAASDFVEGNVKTVSDIAVRSDAIGFKLGIIIGSKSGH